MTGYDPYEHAEVLGIEVLYRPIRTANGLWIPEHEVIIIRQGMSARFERSTLTHEIGHALARHCGDDPKQEHQADRWAAKKLINPAKLARAIRYAPDMHSLAVELDVTTPLVVAYLRSHRLTA